jgi:polynucleotide 5'-kinase involved in rRNA processing
MFHKHNMGLKDVPSVVDGLKKLYEHKIKPIEELYRFPDFHSPLMRDSDFDAKPMILLIGQYSTGKTTFIEYILQRHYPGSNIGPEPTTGMTLIGIVHFYFFV